MGETLDVHSATDDERRQMYRDTYGMWGRKDLAVEEHVAWRMQCPQHARARWYVAQLDGRTVASLGAYPLMFRLGDRLVRGIAIGAVHTRPDFRRRGFAPQLLAEVERREQTRGNELSLLYSDIEPQFYARLGYQPCESWHGSLRAGHAAASGARLAPCSPHDEQQALARFYESADGRLAISIARDESYWRFMFQKGADDSFYWVETSGGTRVGYVRLGRRGDAALLRDWGLDDHSRWPELAAALARFRSEHKLSHVEGWLPNTPEIREHFDLEPRTREITMIKPLSAGIDIDEIVRADAQHLREIDHV